MCEGERERKRKGKRKRERRKRREWIGGHVARHIELID